jgi:hypothetical protein
MKLKTSEFLQKRRIIIERQKQEAEEIKAAVLIVLSRLKLEKEYEQKCCRCESKV